MENVGSCGSDVISDKGMDVSALQQAVPEEERRATRHEFRCQIIASLKVVCPDCGNIYTGRINWNSWTIRCGNKQCRAAMVIGIHAAMIRAIDGRCRKPIRPIDTLMPAGPVIGWKSGEPIHRLLSDDDDSDSID